MKKYLTIVFLLVFAFGVQAKKDKKSNSDTRGTTVYMYGLSTCFNDTVAYLTDVIEVQGAYYYDKSRFLGERHEYSVQLKNYFESQGKVNRVCTVFFCEKKEKAEKAYVKLRKRLSTKDGYLVQQLTSDKFAFTPIKYSN